MTNMMLRHDRLPGERRLNEILVVFVNDLKVKLTF